MRLATGDGRRTASVSDVQSVATAISRLIGDVSAAEAPRGYSDSLALCLIDSVHSLRVRYATVEQVLQRYRAVRTQSGASAETDGTEELLATFRLVGGGEAWAVRIGTRHTAPGTTVLKAEALRRGAEAMHRVGVHDIVELRSAAIDEARHAEVRAAWLGVRGLGRVSWDYVLLLSGDDRQVKADTMVRRFVARAVGDRAVSVHRARQAVQGAAEVLGLAPRTLDHVIWRYESALARAKKRSVPES